MPSQPESATPPARRRKVLLHPLLVTVPIGCWMASAVFDVASRSADRPAEFTTASTWLVVIGLLAAVIAGLAGFVESLPIPVGTVAHRRFVVHLMFAGAVLVLYMLDYLMRLGAPPDRPVPAGLVVFSLVNAAVLVVTMGTGAAIRAASR
ncbi:DUF2231 domain-containing protein [Amycolatopsis tucumanensis]|nr:DUF2231 domain-containing protein [Amycolatopsis tucumanensis]MCF6427688.1 DUF2231 domain-containing protein [Amycolatopsis tucumanensis]